MVKRSSNKLWLEATRRNAVKGGLAKKGIKHTSKAKQKMSLTRRRGLRCGRIVPWKKGLSKVQVAWNKGETKETHPGMLSISKQLKAAYASGEKEIQSRRDWMKWYKGPNGRIQMRSGYELAFALWCDRNKIKWQYEPDRFPVTVGHVHGTYTPDFYLTDSNCYIEVKGQLTKQDMKKYAAFNKQHPEVKWVLMMGEGLRAVGALPLRAIA